ncbi:MAG: chromosome segregation protein SMC [Myxococcota bacterium]
MGGARLRIRSLELVGFKSFGDRTVFPFDRGISAIVGPNGCGKSNVIDALRWVMGEHNPRQLRGRDMQDLIFAGTEKKPAVGMCEVVLTLDNSDGLAAPPYGAYSEIQVARRLYRSGESEYVINKIPVRMRDVLDFFMDTGVGTRGYTIVEQGQIADLVSSKPEERRVIFEQAAGIGKYRQRRKETESKLRATEQNLLRVNDILVELRRQIASLDRQAAKASRYKKLRAQQRDLELVVAHETWGRDSAELRTGQATLEGLRAEGVGLDARAGRADADLESTRRAHLDHERELSRESEALFQVRSAIQSLESRIGYERREREGLVSLADEREAELREREVTLAADAAGLLDALARVAEVEARLHADEQELARRDADLRAQAERLATAQGRREALHARLVELSGDEASVQAQTERLQERRDELELRLRETEEGLEESAHEVDRMRGDELGLENRLRLALAEQDEFGRQLAEQLRAHEGERERQRQLVRELDEQRERLQHVSAQLESVREIEKRETQRAQAVLESLPESERGRVRGLLASTLHAADGLETAVEAVLANRLEGLLVESTGSALDLLRHLRERGVGRATLLPLRAGPERSESGFVPMGRPLGDFVTVDPASAPIVARLLRDVYLVDDLELPIERFGAASPPALFVTRAGELLDRSGALTGGLGAPPGALSRAGEIRRLTSELSELEPVCGRLAAELAESNARVDAFAREIENTRNRRHTAELAVVNIDKDLERMRERGKYAQESLEEHRSGKHALLAQIEQVGCERERAVARKSELAQERGRTESSRSELQIQLQQLARELERAEQRVVSARIELAELGARSEQATQARDRLQTAVEDARAWLARRGDELRGARSRAEELARSASEAQAQLDGEIRREEMLRQSQEALRHQHEASGQAVEGFEAEVRAVTREREALRERHSACDMAVHDVRMRCEQLAATIRERYELEIAGFTPEPGQLSGTPEEREAELERVRQALRALGEVHLGAIEEYEEVSERNRYLSEQKADLELSIERLRGAIARINRTSRERFRETFEAIDKVFQTVFPKMFEGGRAHLSLTESEDVLDAGIEISAQPPGKKLQNVNLLSGGEKSLTAMALLVAVFTVKPSPFFLLDEVDAALDDANANRFNSLLREMSKTSQFLMITHNKQSIEIADALFGVTMQEPGLSKLVTVDLVS